MKKILFYTVFSLCFSGSILFAQTQTLAPTFQKQKSSFHLQAGTTIPLGPDMFKDYWNTGFTLAGGMETNISPSLSLLGIIDYSSFGLKGDDLLSATGYDGYGLSISGGAYSVFSISESLKYVLSKDQSQATPYILFGGGYSRCSTGDITLSGGGQSASAPIVDSESSLLFNAGLGIEFPSLSKRNLYLEARYVVLFTEGEKTKSLSTNKIILNG